LKGYKYVIDFFFQRAEYFIGSETVDLDQVFLDSEFSDHEVGDFAALIALKLDNVTKFFVFHNTTVGGELFFENFQNSLGIIFSGDALDSSQSFATIALLNTDVDKSYNLVFVITRICEGVIRFEIVEGHKLRI